MIRYMDSIMLRFVMILETTSGSLGGSDEVGAWKMENARMEMIDVHPGMPKAKVHATEAGSRH